MATGRGMPGDVDVDAVIIGAGPAGTTFARTLAQAGRSVLVLERRRFPRFHVGESMLPYLDGLVDQLGLRSVIDTYDYVIKRGVEITNPTGGMRRIEFVTQGPGRPAKTFQAERAHFDRVLAEQAREAGATLVEGANVGDVLFDGDRAVGVVYEHEGTTRTVRARFTIDASGLAGKLAGKLGVRRSIDSLRMVAVYRHFRGVDEGNNPGDPGDLQIGNHDEGWLWGIPIWRDVLSIGAVTTKDVLRSSTPERIFDSHLARIPRMSARVRGAVPATEVFVDTDYCYYTDTLAGPGWFMVGDAGCFVDPVFSAGVYLGMVTGLRAAEAVDAAITEPGREADERQRYTDFYKTGYDTYTRLIHEFYAHNYDFARYLASLPAELDRKWIVRLVSGDFWSEHNPVSRMLRATRRWDTFQPFTPIYRCPVYHELDAAEQAAETAWAR